MTRENKLALVVGFGLILFVGILISDHFSTARSQESADLRASRAVDPLVEGRRRDPGLIDLAANTAESRSGAASPLAVSTAQIPAQSRAQNSSARHRDDVRPVIEPQADAGVARIVMGPDPRAEANRAPADPRIAFHDVRPGESLIAICRRYYGDESLVQELARFNDMSDPNALRAHHRLRIPSAEMLRPGATPATDTTVAAPAAAHEEESADSTPTIVPTGTRAPERQPSDRTYTVESGDTLSEISLKTLGTSKRWREIYELNRDRIKDPDNVIVGTELRIPARNGR